MKILKLIFAFFFLASITVYARKEKVETIIDISDKWKTLKEKNYSIQYPQNWELNQSGQMGTSFFVFSPSESEKDLFSENVNLIIQDLKGLDIDLDKFVEISEEQISTLIENGNLIESKRIKEKNNDYHKIIFTGKQGEHDLKFEQYYWVIKEKAYILTLTCEEAKFENYQETGEKILNSFKLKNK